MASASKKNNGSYWGKLEREWNQKTELRISWNGKRRQGEVRRLVAPPERTGWEFVRHMKREVIRGRAFDGGGRGKF